MGNKLSLNCTQLLTWPFPFFIVKCIFTCCTLRYEAIRKPCCPRLTSRGVGKCAGRQWSRLPSRRGHGKGSVGASSRRKRSETDLVLNKTEPSAYDRQDSEVGCGQDETGSEKSIVVSFSHANYGLARARKANVKARGNVPNTNGPVVGC